MLRQIIALLGRQEKTFFLLLLAMTLLLSIIETVGVSAIMPFVSLVSDPTQIETNRYYREAYRLLAFGSAKDFIVAFGLGLVFFYLFRGAYNLVYVYVQQRFLQNRVLEISNTLFKRYLYMPYREFTGRNSADLTNRLNAESKQLSGIIGGYLTIFAETLTSLFLYAMLLAVNVKMTLALTAILAVKVLFLTKVLSKRIKQAGKIRLENQQKVFAITAETLGNFKLIKLLSNQRQIAGWYRTASRNYAGAMTRFSTMRQFPRAFLETAGFSILILVMVYVVARYEDPSFILPIVTMYALALYRMLPAVNKIMGAFQQLHFYRETVRLIHKDIAVRNPEELREPVAFREEIRVRNLSFSYGEQRVLDQIDLAIPKNRRVGLVGPSGSGKSTLADILMGVHAPSEGELLIDGVPIREANIVGWRKKIGYIPQDIYLFDGTVADNVALGHEMDESRVEQVLRQAKIYDFLREKEGIRTMVGEGGIKFSGGQKQRIAIARALYHDPEVIVMDEATSALDTATEAMIMEEIYQASSGKTLIIIAHRLSTLHECDIIYKLEKGKVIETRER